MAAALFAPQAPAQQVPTQREDRNNAEFVQSDQIPGMKEAVQDRLKSRLAASGVIQIDTPAEPIIVRDSSLQTAVAEEDFTEEPEVQGNPPAEQVAAEAPQDSTSENFKKLRNTLKETKRTAQDLLTQKVELETKVQKYEKGEVVTEETKKLRERILQLEPLEHLVNLKKSDGYAHKVETLNSKTDSLKALGKDYELPEDVMEKASKITNKRELNSFLDQHFDGVGALQAAQAISEIQGIRGELKAAEDAPRQALEKLNQDHLALTHQKEVSRRNQIVDTSKNSWMSGLLELRNEGSFQEIIPRENDTQFNETWVEPITKKASEEYGKLINALGEDGLKRLDPEVGKGLVKMALKAVGHDTATARANAAERALEELQRNTQRENHMIRPRAQGMGGGVPPAPTPKKALGADNVGRAILNNVGVKY